MNAFFFKLSPILFISFITITVMANNIPQSPQRNFKNQKRNKLKTKERSILSRSFLKKRHRAVALTSGKKEYMICENG